MPAISRWSRSSEWRRRESEREDPRDAPRRERVRLGTEVRELLSTCVGPEQPHARALLRRRPRSAAARRRRRTAAGTPASSAPLAPLATYLRRPALIRCTITTSSSSSVGSRKRLARRSTPRKPSPSSAESGGSKVLSVAMCAGPAFTIGDRLTSGSSWRRQASTSGNSGNVRSPRAWTRSG